MSDIFFYSAILIFAAFIASCSQILLKRSALKTHKNKLSEYLNLNVIVAYVLFASSMAVSMYLLRYIPISLTPILESTGYVFVAILSCFLLGEKTSKVQIWGMVFIIIGVILFSS